MSTTRLRSDLIALKQRATMLALELPAESIEQEFALGVALALNELLEAYDSTGRKEWVGYEQGTRSLTAKG